MIARFVLRRALLMIPTFFGITVLTFAVMHLAPGDPLATRWDAHGGPGQGDAALSAQRRAWGLDQPLWLQYAQWVGRVATLDFGRSLQDGRPVVARIGEALPATLLLTSAALILAWALAIPLGLWGAVRQGTWADRLLGIGLFAVYALPAFWVAVMLLLFLATDRGVAWFPLQGLTSAGFEALSFGAKVRDLLWHLALPVIVLALGTMALVGRHMRSSLLEVIRQDFIRTARAKGLSERAVILRHALRNGLLPMITLLGLMLPHLLGGSVVVEQIFGIRGMGLLAYDALLNRDYPVVMGITTLVALLTMVSLLLSDLAYAAADPRVTLEGTG